MEVFILNLYGLLHSDLRGRSMWDNIIIHPDPAMNDFNEAKSENCVGLVKEFLRKILDITSDIYIQSDH